MTALALERIPSSISDAEVAVLVELATGARVLELGTYHGLSAVAMAGTAEVVHSVDWHLGDPHAGNEDTAALFIANLTERGVRSKVVAHVGRSERVLPLFRPDAFDLVFIDAYHTEDAVRQDIRDTLPLLRPGGVMAFHDYGDPRFGVTAAVDAFSLELDWLRRVESLAVLVKR